MRALQLGQHSRNGVKLGNAIPSNHGGSNTLVFIDPWSWDDRPGLVRPQGLCVLSLQLHLQTSCQSRASTSGATPLESCLPSLPPRFGG